LRPHRAETFKLSTDPLFIDKARDILGLYLEPLRGAGDPEASNVYRPAWSKT
jgi:hypothetical protein